MESWEKDQSAYEEKHKFSPYHTQVRGVSIFLTTHVDVNSRVHSNDTGFSATVFSGKGAEVLQKTKLAVDNKITPASMIAMGLELEEIVTCKWQRSRCCL